MTHPNKQSPNDLPPQLTSSQAIKLALATPWKARNELERILLSPFAWLSLRGINIDSGWKFYGLPILQIHRQSDVKIGKRMSLRSTRRSNPLGANHPVIISTRVADAHLEIGDDFGMTGGSLVCEEYIRIGNRVLVGANTIISDTDFHPLDPIRRQTHPIDGQTSPIIIEDDVFIGMQCLILKGVTIGARSIIGAGSVVTKNVPADSIIAGNPARIIRHT